MPITAIALSNFWDMACSLSLAPLPSILSLVGQEHGRTIPLTEVAALRICDAAAAVIEGSGMGPPDSWRKSLKGQHPRGPPRSLHVSRSGGLLQRHRLSAPRDNRGRRGRRAQSSKPNSKRSSTVRLAG